MAKMWRCHHTGRGCPPTIEGIAKGEGERAGERERERDGGREGEREREPKDAAIAYSLHTRKGRQNVHLVDGGFVHGERVNTEAGYRGCMADGGFVHGETW